MQVLVALSRSGGEPVSRETLIECCWGGRVVTDGALNRSVARLRKALRDPGIQVETISEGGVSAAGRSRRADGARADAGARTSRAHCAPERDGRRARAAAAHLMRSAARQSSERRGFGRSAVLTLRSCLARSGAHGCALLASERIALAGHCRYGSSSRAPHVIWTASNYRPLTSTPEQENLSGALSGGHADRLRHARERLRRARPVL